MKKKLYIENKYCDGKNDDGDAMLAWERYLVSSTVKFIFFP